MSFTDDYLQKHAFRGPLIAAPPQDDLHCVIVIPAYKEPDLYKSLGSLFLCTPPGVGLEVIVLISSSEDEKEISLESNKISYDLAMDWTKHHQRADMLFHLLKIDDLPKKHAGAGLARKILMDEAVRRLGEVNNPQGIVLSLDADAWVDKNYLTAVYSHLKDPQLHGCSIYFEHPMEEEEWIKGWNDKWLDSQPDECEPSVGEFDEAIYDAIVNYELHLRYYLHSIRLTGYPFAYHTVGSAFAVKADVYCSQGGMNKRQAGEDFYFIQKIAQLGRWSECNTTIVHPSPRPSDRVVFGTGPDIQRQLENPGVSYKSYDKELIVKLTNFYQSADSLYKTNSENDFLSHIDPLLKSYLLQNDFMASVEEIRLNSSSDKSFKTRFYKRFNMLWILKFLHWAEEHGYPKTNLNQSALNSLSLEAYKAIPNDARSLLKQYRKLEKNKA